MQWKLGKKLHSCCISLAEIQHKEAAKVLQVTSPAEKGLATSLAV